MSNKINNTNILIVDDQFEMRELISCVLRDSYSVATAAGAKEAYEYMADNPANLVLLDIKMPDIDGITALGEIKKRHPETEVIMLTAYASPETINKAFLLGAFNLLFKPFDNNKLVNTVDKAFKKAVRTNQ